MKREFIPRPLRACLWALLALLLAIAYYIALGCPTLTFLQEFRRAEKVHMVGPSKIVDQLPTSEYGEFETMLVGETDHGIIFFGKYGSTRSGGKFSGDRYYRFSYQEKTGDVSFAAPPNIFGYTGIYDLPVYVFTEYEDAIRATISITVEGSRTYSLDNQKIEDPFDEVFQAEAERDQNGFFCFGLTAQFNYSDADPFDWDNDVAYALFSLSNLCNDSAIHAEQKTMVIPITVTLYDAEGDVLVTRELTLGPWEAPK